MTLQGKGLLIGQLLGCCDTMCKIGHTSFWLATTSLSQCKDAQVFALITTLMVDIDEVTTLLEAEDMEIPEPPGIDDVFMAEQSNWSKGIADLLKWF